MHGGLKNINITWQNTVSKKKKKEKNLYTKISYYILVMNISMDEFVRIGIDSHEIHADEVKMHYAQVRLMFAFWGESFSICFSPPRLPPLAWIRASTINIVLYENDW